MINSLEKVIVKYSRRAKYARLSVYPDLRVVLTVPYNASQNMVQKFLNTRADWLSKSLKKFEALGLKNIAGSFKEHKKEAEKFVKMRVAELNSVYGFKYNRVSVKNSKSRWGSCSKKGNLNFNYKIIFLPKELQDYLIVHELCHLKEMNHSQKFWQEVAKTIPRYAEARKDLKKYI